jgi:glutamine---fructose-6-phosphate transaminase (isomerizing)
LNNPDSHGVHKMLSYIYESGLALERTIRQGEVAVEEIVIEARRRGCRRVILSGVGSSYTAACAARPAFDCLVDIPTYLIPATELSFYGSLLGHDTLVLLLSRSGERKFLIDALAVAQDSGALTVLVTGAANSIMAQQASRLVLTSEGPEASFPKTKSVTAGIGIFLAFALALAGEQHEEAVVVRSALQGAPALIDEALELAVPALDEIEGSLLTYDQVIVAGTGCNTGVAMEMQIKLQESALVTTEWMDTGNLFHGPLCLLDKSWLTVLLVTSGDLEISSETFRLVDELGGRTLGLIPSDLAPAVMPEHLIPLPRSPHRLCEALIYLPVLQLLSYRWTIGKGLDPDSPSGSDVIMGAMLPEGRVEAEARL